MKPESWFTKELQLIYPELEAVWFSQYEKFFLAKQFPRMIEGITEYEPQSGKFFVVELVLEDEQENRIPLDGRLLETLRIMNYEKHTYRLKEMVKRWHAGEEKAKADSKNEQQIGIQELFKTIYRLQKTKTFDLGG